VIFFEVKTYVISSSINNPIELKAISGPLALLLAPTVT